MSTKTAAIRYARALFDVALKEQADLLRVEQELAAFNALFDNQPTLKKVLLNLGEVSYVDSAGLGEIVQSYATVTKNGGKLKLLNVTKRIKDLLSITKLLTVFECHDSEADALKSF